MLSYIGSNNVIVTLYFIECAENFFRLRILVVGRNFIIKIMFPFAESFKPFCVILLFHTVAECLKYIFKVAEHILAYLNIFIDFFFVNFKLYNFSLCAEFISVASNTVRKSCTARNNKVALVGSHTCFIAAVHTYITHTKRVVGRNTAKSHKRTANGNICKLCKFFENFRCVCADNTAACIYNRLFGISYHILNFFDFFGIFNAYSFNFFRLYNLKFGFVCGNILWYINQNRTFSA